MEESLSTLGQSEGHQAPKEQKLAGSLEQSHIGSQSTEQAFLFNPRMGGIGNKKRRNVQKSR